MACRHRADSSTMLIIEKWQLLISPSSSQEVSTTSQAGTMYLFNYPKEGNWRLVSEEPPPDTSQGSFPRGPDGGNAPHSKLRT